MLANLEDGPVTRKALELCEAILKQPDFQLLREQGDAFMANAEVQRQYEELSEQGAMLQHKQQMGDMVDAAEINDFEQKREAFLKNPVARGFLDAQQLMHDVRETVAREWLGERDGVWFIDHDLFVQEDAEAWLEDMDCRFEGSNLCLCHPSPVRGPTITNPAFWLYAAAFFSANRLSADWVLAALAVTRLTADLQRRRSLANAR